MLHLIDVAPFLKQEVIVIGKKKFKEFIYEYDDTRYKGKYGFIEIENPS